MESEREVLLEIRDVLVRHAQTYADWIAELRATDKGLSAVIEQAAKLERTNNILHRRVLVLGGLVIACMGAVLLLWTLGWRPN